MKLRSRLISTCHLYCLALLLISLLVLPQSNAQAIPEASLSGSNTSNYTINDNSTAQSPITISGAPAGSTVTSVVYSFTIPHTYPGDLAISITNGQGTSYTVWNRLGGTDDGGLDDDAETDEDVYMLNRTISSAFTGNNVNQTWYLKATDNASGDTGYIDTWSITINYTTGTTTGSIRVTAYNFSTSGDVIWPGSVVYLYSGSWVYMTSGTANSSGQVTFSNLATGTYNLELYNTPTGQTPAAQELWHSTSASVSSGVTTPVDMRRSWPIVYLYDSNALSYPTSPFYYGQAASISLKTFNPRGGTYTHRVYMLVDRDKASPYDYSYYCTPSSVSVSGTSPYTFSCNSPVINTPGTYYIYYRIDSYTSAYVPTDQNNWWASFTVLGKPDLAVSSVSPSASSAAPGSSISVSYTIANQGNAASVSMNNEVRWSTDSTINTSDTLLATCSMGAIAAGSSSTSSCPVTIPSGAMPNTYYIGVIADSNGANSESNESNNTRSSAFTVLGKILATVYNYTTGGDVAYGGTVVKLYDSSWNYKTQQTTDGYGQTTFTNLAPGTYNLEAWNTPTGQSPAAAELWASSPVTVNSSSQTATLALRRAYPIVYVSDPNALSYPAESLVGNTASIGLKVFSPRGYALSARVHMILDRSKSAPYDYEYDCTPSSYTFSNTSPYNFNCTSPAITTTGLYYIYYRIEGMASTWVATDQNNWWAGTNVVGKPDLVVSSVTPAPTSALPGTSVSVSFTIANQGSAASNPMNNEIRWSADSTITTADAYLTTCAIGGIGIGASSSTSCPVTIPSGAMPNTYYIGVIADTNSANNEIDETNNTRAGSFTVLGKILATVYNYTTTGDVAYGGTVVKLYDSNWNYKSQQTTDTNGQTTFTNLAPGTYNLEAWQTPAGQSPAASELWTSLPATVDNTQQTTPLALRRAYPIIYVSDPKALVLPTEALIGNSAPIGLRVFSPRGWTYNTRVHLIVDRSKTAPYDYEYDCTPSSYTLTNATPYTFNCATPVINTPGVYYVYYRIEAMASTWVATDQNNWNGSFTVLGKPDLVVSSVTPAPSSALPGTSVSVSFTITNQGSAASNPMNNEIRWSTDSTINTSDAYLTTCAIGGIGIGASSSTSCPVTIPSGAMPNTYYIGVIADTNAANNEIDETNNTRAGSFTVLGKILATVYNYTTTGDVTRSGVVVKLYDSNWIYKSQQTTDTNGQTTFTNLAPGTYNLEAWQTPAGQSPAASELWTSLPATVDNTQQTTPLALRRAYPIIYVNDPNSLAVPGEILAGSSAGITLKVFSPRGWTYDTRVHMILDRSKTAPYDYEYDCTPASYKLTNATPYTFNCASPAINTTGTYYAYFRIEGLASTWVATDQNNWGGSFTVVSKPDLVVTSLAAHPLPAYQAQSLVVDFTIKNQGTLNAAAFTNDIRLSADSTITAADSLLRTCNSNGLSAGYSEAYSCVVTIPETQAPNTYYLGIIADSGSTINEVLEGNNTSSISLNITASYYVSTYVEDDFGDWVAGATVKYYTSNWSDLLFQGNTAPAPAYGVNPAPRLPSGTFPYEITGPVLSDGSREYWGTGSVTVSGAAKSVNLPRNAPFLDNVIITNSSGQEIDQYQPICLGANLQLKVTLGVPDLLNDARQARVTIYANPIKSLTSPLPSQTGLAPRDTFLFNYQVPNNMTPGQRVYINPVVEGWYNNQWVITDRDNWNYGWYFDTRSCPPPTVTDHSPTGNTLPVHMPDNILMVEFDQPMDASTITGSTFFVKAAGQNPVAANIVYDSLFNTAFLNLTTNLAYGTEYTVTVKGGEAGVRSLASIPMAADYTWTFSTRIYRGTITEAYPTIFMGAQEYAVTLTLKNPGYGPASFRVEPVTIPSGWSISDKDGDFNNYLQADGVGTNEPRTLVFYATAPKLNQNVNLTWRVSVLNQDTSAWQVSEDKVFPVTVVVDTTPPVFSAVSVDVDNKGHMTVYATVTDPAPGSGVQASSVVVYYDDIDDLGWGHAQGLMSSLGSNQYSRLIPAGNLLEGESFSDQHRIEIYLKARDLAGNETSQYVISPKPGNEPGEVIYLRAVNGQNQENRLVVTDSGERVVGVTFENVTPLLQQSLRSDIRLHNYRNLWLEIKPYQNNSSGTSMLSQPAFELYSNGTDALLSLVNRAVYNPKGGDILGPLKTEVFNWPPIIPEDRYLSYRVESAPGDSYDFSIHSWGTTVIIMDVLEPVVSLLGADENDLGPILKAVEFLFSESPTAYGYLKDGRPDEAFKELGRSLVFKYGDKIIPHLVDEFGKGILWYVTHGYIKSEDGIPMYAKSVVWAEKLTKVFTAISKIETAVNIGWRVIDLIRTPAEDHVAIEHMTAYDVDINLEGTIPGNTGYPGVTDPSDPVLRWNVGQNTSLVFPVSNLGSQYLFDVWLQADLYEPSQATAVLDSQGKLVKINVAPGRKIESIRTPIKDSDLQDFGNFQLTVYGANNQQVQPGYVTIPPGTTATFKILNYPLTQNNHPLAAHTYYAGTYQLRYALFIDGYLGENEGIPARRITEWQYIDVQIVDNQTPDSPFNLQGAIDSGMVYIDWSEPKAWSNPAYTQISNRDIAGYLVYRSTSPATVGQGNPYGKTPSNASFFADEDPNLVTDQVYYYAVQAYDIKGTKSALSNVISLVPKPGQRRIEGRITGNTGASIGVVALSGFPQPAATNEEGYYSVLVDNGWSGTVTPSASGYRFQSSNGGLAYTTYTNVTTHQINQNYTAYPQTLKVSGYIRLADQSPLKGVLVSAGSGGSAQTNDQGYYEITIPSPWSGQITTSMEGYNFAPDTPSFTNVVANFTQDFTASKITFTVQGTILYSGGGAVSGVLLDGLPCNVYTDDQGHYTCSVPYGWSGLVVPRKDAHRFVDMQTSYSPVKADKTTNYTATQCVAMLAPSQPQPGDGDQGVALSPSLSWQNVTGAVNYQVLFGSANPPSGYAERQTNQWSPGALSADTRYYWKVTAVNACGDTVTGPLWNFKTLFVNQLPSLGWVQQAGYITDGINPESGSESTSFSYRVLYSDPDGDAPAYVRLHLFKNGSEVPGSPFIMAYLSGSYITGAVFQYQVSGLAPLEDYTYSFEARDSHSGDAVTSVLNGPSVQNVYWIEHTPPGQSVAGKPVAVLFRLRCQDSSICNEDVQQARLLYIKNGQVDFQELVVSLGPDGWYAVDVPGSDVAASALQYMLRVTTASGVTETGMFSVPVVNRYFTYLPMVKR